MKSLINYLLRVVLISLACLLTACLSSNLVTWGTHQTDTISSFLITADQSQIVIIGEHYHYVLDQVDPALMARLSREHRKGFSIKENSLDLHADGRVSGTVTVQVDTAVISNEEKIALLANEYHSSKPNLSLQRNFIVAGKVYKAKKVLQSNALQLNKAYTLQLDKDAEDWQRAVKLPLTPVVIVADIGLVLGGITLICVYNRITGYGGISC